MGGERGMVGWFIVMRMVIATVMATATVQEKEGSDKEGRGEWRDGFVSINCFYFWYT
jgi:hypothetical protein